ncbi:hypothetical protein [Nitrosopumilus sp.]|uniref:hypothetical protein n=1 Tax=Nitrosopumilus sp. TaxID=2024843 RepID=UPI003D10DADB
MYNKKYYQENRERILELMKKYRNDPNSPLSKRERSFKHRVIFYYSDGTMKCKCCEESLFEGLTIDHINGDGKKHRETGCGHGQALYQWLVKNDYPEGFQVLCGTCNIAKGTKKECPHKHNI